MIVNESTGPRQAARLPSDGLCNPVWMTNDNLRDPSVLPVGTGYLLFYTRFSGKDGRSPEHWTVARAFTENFRDFDERGDLSPTGHASPGDVVFWHGRYLLPFQTYPAAPTRLCFSASANLSDWSTPKPFLSEACDLPWNDMGRVIDPTFVVENDTLHCWFVGSTRIVLPNGGATHANLLGHAFTRDPDLADWTITTADAPLLGISPEAPDGVENVAVFRTGEEWTMIYSEGLAHQHLAWATSSDLRVWNRRGALAIPSQAWCARKHGAPFVWQEEGVDGHRWMILMGEDEAGHTTFGLLHAAQADGSAWISLPECGATREALPQGRYTQK